LKLNLGCGPEKLEGWVNVDFEKGCKPDVVADVRQLPFEDETVDELYASHLLEHFDYREPVLEEWHRVLKLGGNITLIVPDLVGTWYSWKAGFSWGSPDLQLIDLAYMNATVFGAKILSDKFVETSHDHKQVFIMDMLVERMRPLFPNAQQISSIILPGLEERRAFPGETLVRGTKVFTKRITFRVEGKGAKI
jgi:predicted SAM-dependent methyltransferase